MTCRCATYSTAATPRTATLQNAHSDDAAAEWMSNRTHLRYAARWLHRALAEFRPVADSRPRRRRSTTIRARTLTTEPIRRRNLQHYLTWLEAQARAVVGPGDADFQSTPTKWRVPASSPGLDDGKLVSERCFQHRRARPRRPRLRDPAAGDEPARPPGAKRIPSRLARTAPKIRSRVQPTPATPSWHCTNCSPSACMAWWIFRCKTRWRRSDGRHRFRTPSTTGTAALGLSDLSKGFALRPDRVVRVTRKRRRPTPDQNAAAAVWVRAAARRYDPGVRHGDPRGSPVTTRAPWSPIEIPRPHRPHDT